MDRIATIIQEEGIREWWTVDKEVHLVDSILLLLEWVLDRNDLIFQPSPLQPYQLKIPNEKKVMSVSCLFWLLSLLALLTLVSAVGTFALMYISSLIVIERMDPQTPNNATKYVQIQLIQSKTWSTSDWHKTIAAIHLICIVLITSFLYIDYSSQKIHQEIWHKNSFISKISDTKTASFQDIWHKNSFISRYLIQEQLHFNLYKNNHLSFEPGWCHKSDWFFYKVLNEEGLSMFEKELEKSFVPTFLFLQCPNYLGGLITLIV